MCFIIRSPNYFYEPSYDLLLERKRERIVAYGAKMSKKNNKKLLTSHRNKISKV
jgi:hypothetical protein